MDHQQGSPGRDLPHIPSPELANQIARLEYAVFTEASPELAWRIFSNIELWPKFCDFYEEVRWKGSPWTPGSKLLLKFGGAVAGLVTRVVTSCTPAHHVSWISHIRGCTMEQWVSFESFHGNTRVTTWSEATGAAKPKEDIDFLENMIQTWFERFRQECDRAAAQSSGDITAPQG